MIFNKPYLWNIISIIIICFVGCCQNKKPVNDKVSISDINGIWAYYLDSIYHEVYVDSNCITIQPENEPFLGSHKYLLKNDSIYYLDFAFLVKIKNCNRIVLLNDLFKLKLLRIDIEYSLSEIEKLQSGFWLRRCCYLHNQNVISLEEAYQAFIQYYDYIDQDSLIIKEKTIFSFNKKD